MSSQENNKEKNKKWLIIVVLLVVVLAGAIAFGAYMAFKGNDKGDEPQPTQTAKTDKDVLHQEAGLITSEDDAKNYEKSEGKSFTTDYKRTIVVTDGNKAQCYIGNSSKNQYENMYFQLFLLNDKGEIGDELYLSGTIPRGSRIESMELEKNLEPGKYDAVLTFVSLNDNNEIVSSVNFSADILAE